MLAIIDRARATAKDGEQVALKTHTLSIYLLKTGLTETDCLRASRPTQQCVVQLPNGGSATLHVATSAAHRPTWYSLLAPVTPTLPNLLTSNVAGVLLLTVSKRLFAIAFGFGRMLLKPGCWEEDFGLKATINSVDPARIHSIDHLSLDSIGQYGRIQASREATIAEFGLDVEQDVLRAVIGSPTDTSLGKVMAGKDALRVTLPISIQEIPELLGRYLLESQSDKYKAMPEYAWIDQIQEVRDSSKVDELDAALMAKVNGADFNRLWLTVPTLLDWEQIDGFKFREARSAQLHPDVHLTEFLSEIGGPADASLEMLKRKHVHAISSQSGDPYESWQVYRCLYCELEIGGETYLLTNAKWYRIGSGFRDRVDNAFKKMKRTGFALPDYTDKSEGAYNKRVVDEAAGQFALMDQKNIKCDDARGKVEFCDLYGEGKKIVHVKRYSGSSAPLSHLFAQALTSGVLFRRDAEFRKSVNALLPTLMRSVLKVPTLKEYEVVLGIVSKSKKDLVLPFFSRVNVNNTRARLEELGYDVSLLKIQATV